MARQTKPSNPAAAMAARLKSMEAAAAAEREDASRPERWGVAAEALALPTQTDVTARLDGRGRVAHAHRADVFERLHERGSLSAAPLAAVRRLERDVGLRAGLFRPAADLVKVDAQAKASGATERMLEAGRRVEAALLASGPRSAQLLRALIEPALFRGEAVDWRAVALRETGEENPHAQAAAVRAACDNLQLAYQALDRANRSENKAATSHMVRT